MGKLKTLNFRKTKGSPQLGIKPNLDVKFLHVSLIGIFARCPRYFYYWFVRNWVSKGFSQALLLGSLFHQALDLFYSGYEVKEVIKIIRSDIDDKYDQESMSSQDVAILELCENVVFGMVSGYARVYEKDRALWKVLGVPEDVYKVYIEVPGTPVIPTFGTLDLVAQNKRREVWVWDHKTTTQLSMATLNAYAIRLQFGIYPYLVMRTFGKTPQGLMLNLVRKPTKSLKRNQTYPEYVKELRVDYSEREEFYYKREYFRWSKKRIDTALADWHFWVKLIFQMMDRPDKVLLDPKCWARNDTACLDYGGCPYVPLCKLGLRYDTLIPFKEREARYPFTPQGD